MLDWFFAIFSPVSAATKGGRYDIDDSSDSGSSDAQSSHGGQAVQDIDPPLPTTPRSPKPASARFVMNPSTPPRVTGRGRPKTPPAPTKPKPSRGRPPNRLTSAQRSPTTAGRKKKISRRRPLTPTTKTAVAKERRHRAYLKKRAREMEAARLLGRVETYWRVLRSGRRYRALGGTRPK